MIIFAFSFAASRAPEWSSGLSAMARSYAALTLIGISSVLAYSRPLNWIMVLGLALIKRRNQCPNPTVFATTFRLVVPLIQGTHQTVCFRDQLSKEPFFLRSSSSRLF